MGNRTVWREKQCFWIVRFPRMGETGYGRIGVCAGKSVFGCSYRLYDSELGDRVVELVNVAEILVDRRNVDELDVGERGFI
jgi:hypothetical protein